MDKIKRYQICPYCHESMRYESSICQNCGFDEEKEFCTFKSVVIETGVKGESGYSCIVEYYREARNINTPQTILREVLVRTDVVA